MRTVLIEDEPKALQVLTQSIQTYCPQLELVGQATNALEGQKLILSAQPQLVFLDIEMPGGSGFDLLESLQEIHFQTIFVSAHSKYLQRALRLCVLDYLLKPVDVDDLVAAVERAEQKAQESKGTNTESVQRFLQESAKRKIAVPSQNGRHYILADELMYVKAEGSYSNLFLKDQPKPTLVSRRLIDIQESLSQHHFFRVSRFHLVNLDHVLEYLRISGGILVMTDRKEIPISKKYRDSLNAALSNLSQSL